MSKNLLIYILNKKKIIFFNILVSIIFYFLYLYFFVGLYTFEIKISYKDILKSNFQINHIKKHFARYSGKLDLQQHLWSLDDSVFFKNTKFLKEKSNSRNLEKILKHVNITNPNVIKSISKNSYLSNFQGNDFYINYKIYSNIKLDNIEINIISKNIANYLNTNVHKSFKDITNDNLLNFKEYSKDLEKNKKEILNTKKNKLDFYIENRNDIEKKLYLLGKNIRGKQNVCVDRKFTYLSKYDCIKILTRDKNLLKQYKNNYIVQNRYVIDQQIEINKLKLNFGKLKKNNIMLVESLINILNEGQDYFNKTEIHKDSKFVMLNFSDFIIFLNIITYVFVANFLILIIFFKNE